MRIRAPQASNSVAERLGPSLGAGVPPGQRGPSRTVAPVLPDVAEEEDLEGYGAGHWVVVVYDNDYNTFDEVIAILLIATRCSLREAQTETWEVHHLGKSVVHFGSEEECKRVAAIISSIGIRVEVREE
ncbi:MAG: hypothetical protein AMXMBFR61_24170 [Fimbriimonadales bacterium]